MRTPPRWALPFLADLMADAQTQLEIIARLQDEATAPLRQIIAQVEALPRAADGAEDATERLSASATDLAGAAQKATQAVAAEVQAEEGLQRQLRQTDAAERRVADALQVRVAQETRTATAVQRSVGIDAEKQRQVVARIAAEDRVTASLARRAQAEDLTATVGSRSRRALEEQGGALDAVGKSATAAASRYGVFLASIAGTIAIREAITNALALDQALARIGATLELTSEQVALARDSIKELAAERGIPLEVALQAFNAAAKETGGVIPEALERTRVALDLVSLGLADQASAVKVVSDALSIFREEQLSAAEVADQYAVAARESASDLGKLAQGIADVGPEAARLGVRLKDLLALFVTLRASGLDEQASFANLKKLFNDAFNADTQDRLRRFGVEFSESRVRAEGLIPVVRELAAQFGQNDAALAQLSQRNVGFGRVLAAVAQDSGRLSEALYDQEAAFGAVDRAAKRARESVSSELAVAREELSSFFAEFVGEPALRALAGGTKFIRGVLADPFNEGGVAARQFAEEANRAFDVLGAESRAAQREIAAIGQELVRLENARPDDFAARVEVLTKKLQEQQTIVANAAVQQAELRLAFVERRIEELSRSTSLGADDQAFKLAAQLAPLQTELAAAREEAEGLQRAIEQAAAGDLFDRKFSDLIASTEVKVEPALDLEALTGFPREVQQAIEKLGGLQVEVTPDVEAAFDELRAFVQSAPKFEALTDDEKEKQRARIEEVIDTIATHGKAAGDAADLTRRLSLVGLQGFEAQRAQIEAETEEYAALILELEKAGVAAGKILALREQLAAARTRRVSLVDASEAEQGQKLLEKVAKDEEARLAQIRENAAKVGDILDGVRAKFATASQGPFDELNATLAEARAQIEAVAAENPEDSDLANGLEGILGTLQLIGDAARIDIETDESQRQVAALNGLLLELRNRLALLGDDAGSQFVRIEAELAQAIDGIREAVQNADLGDESLANLIEEQLIGAEEALARRAQAALQFDLAVRPNVQLRAEEIQREVIEQLEPLIGPIAEEFQRRLAEINVEVDALGLAPDLAEALKLQKAAEAAEEAKQKLEDLRPVIRDIAQEAVRGGEAFSEGFGAAIQDSLERFENDYANGAQFATTITDGLADSFKDAFKSIIDGSKSGSEAIQDFAKDFALSIADAIAQLLAFKAAAAALNFLSPGLGSFGIPGFAQGGIMPGTMQDSGDIPAYAEGGVHKGRHVQSLDIAPPHVMSRAAKLLDSFPVRAYAEGGVATSPQLAVFGEGPGAEAFVPLPGPNRGIPVEFKNRPDGGGARDVTINLNVQSLDPRTAADVILAQMPAIRRGVAVALETGQDRALTNAVRGTR